MKVFYKDTKKLVDNEIDVANTYGRRIDYIELTPQEMADMLSELKYICIRPPPPGMSIKYREVELRHA